MPTWNQPPEEANLLTIPEVAKQLRVNRVTVWRWTISGQIASRKLPSGGRRIPRSEVDRILAQRTIPNPDKSS